MSSQLLYSDEEERLEHEVIDLDVYNSLSEGEDDVYNEVPVRDRLDNNLAPQYGPFESVPIENKAQVGATTDKLLIKTLERQCAVWFFMTHRVSADRLASFCRRSRLVWHTAIVDLIKDWRRPP